MLGQKTAKEDWLSALCAVLALSGPSVKRNKTVQLKGWIRCSVSPAEVFSRGRYSKFYTYSLGCSWREAHIGLLEVSWNIDKQLWRKQAQKISMSSSLCVGFRSSGLFFLLKMLPRDPYRFCFFSQHLLKVKWCNLKTPQTVSAGVCLLKAY